MTALVTEQKLLDYQPEVKAGEVYDFGNQGFTVKGTSQNVQDWYAPLKNNRPPELLLQHLAALAKEKASKLTLYYLRPEVKLD